MEMPPDTGAIPLFKPPHQREVGVAGRFGKYGDVKRKERLRRNVATSQRRKNQALRVRPGSLAAGDRRILLIPKWFSYAG